MSYTSFLSGSNSSVLNTPVADISVLNISFLYSVSVSNVPVSKISLPTSVSIASRPCLPSASACSDTVSYCMGG